MNRAIIIAAALAVSACGQGREPDPYDLDFDIPRTHTFADSLTEVGLFEEPMAELRAPGAVLYELSSELFTDYAFKQRLLMVPDGEAVSIASGGALQYPEGTIMAKTFYYPDDMRHAAGPRQIIETRLLARSGGLWNVATYLWNDAQDEATLLLDGTTTEMSWIDESGESRSTEYEVPHEGQCVTCHQQDGEAAFIGPSLPNLDRVVSRGDDNLPQLEFLRSMGILTDDAPASVPDIPDYRDADRPLVDRARAYLDINCAHCHNPAGWDEATDRDFDFRYTTPLDDTGLTSEPRRVIRALEEGEMPFMGTTLLHDEGVDLVVDYIEGL